MVLLLLLPALLGLTGHHGEVGQIATAQIAQVTTGLGIIGHGRSPARHHHRRRRRRRCRRRRRAAGMREPPEHLEQRAAGAVAPHQPLAGRVRHQPRVAAVRRRALAVEHCAIRRRSHTLLVNLALLETGGSISPISYGGGGGLCARASERRWKFARLFKVVPGR